MNRFNNHEWPAKLLSFQNLKEMLSEEKYCDAKIKRIRTIGEAFNFKDEDYQRSFHFGLETIGVDWYGDFSIYEKYKDEKVVPLKVTLGEPVIIEFDNGINLELMPEKDGFLVAENTIPNDIIDGINNNNYDYEKIFSSVVGERITDVSYSKKSAKPFQGDFIPVRHNSPIFSIRLENGRALFFINDNWDNAYFYFGIMHFGKKKSREIEKTSYQFMKSVDRDKNYITILPGHDTGGYFWIFPVNKPKVAGDYRDVDCLREEQISIGEMHVLDNLYDILWDECDVDLQRSFREDGSGGFDQCLEYNVYTKEQIKNMIQRIRMEIDSLTDESDENNVKKDFYERFIWRMEIMLNHMEGYEYISFKGP